MRSLLAQFLKTFAQHQNYRKFAVVGHARTGSNFLLAGIQQLPGVQLHHEVFASHERPENEAFGTTLNRIYSPQPRSVRAVGFKVFYYHLNDSEWAQLAEAGLSIIHLIRRNRVRTMLSLEIAEQTDEWAKASDTPRRPATIRMDVARLLRRIPAIGELEEDARQRFQHVPFLECAYEDLVREPNEKFRAIAQFLGLPGKVDVEGIVFKRQNPQPLPSLISNYAEVATALEKAGYGDYLTE